MTDPARRRRRRHTACYWGRVLSATMRLARDIDIAEEATADAFVLALQVWPEHGVPESVEAWLLTAARRRAIDRIRRIVRLRERCRRSPATPTIGVDDDSRRSSPTTSCASWCCAATRPSTTRPRWR